ncbi:MAG: sulfatase-like hydrolase/transferase, partial [Candidatus Omnitrophica bacterium]|nr:sulfatase-like hydrolase/transferase [Candidatus Omnitrophota bacterium]MBD3269394.1 sulfatase-like hydrolase/transferase [Candidatus Omnitrophota bacterium]
MDKEAIREFVRKECLSFIQEKINRIAERHKNIILFGAGHHAEYLLENFDFSALSIKAVVDSDPNRHSKFFFNHPILPPEKINEIDTDDTGIIIMAYESQRGMVEQLNSTLNKDMDIFTVYDKEKGESMDCSLYFYNMSKSSGNDRNILEKISAGYYTMCDYRNASGYLSKAGLEDGLLRDIENKEKIIKERFQNKRPNICLVILDCVRAKNLSCYGYGRRTSPFIDSLKSKSLFFENAFSNSNWTLPGHSTILTGKIPSHHGAWGGIKSYLSEKEERFPEVLQSKGYNTIGCFSITFMNQAFGTSKGFDFYEQGPIEDIIINPASLIMHRALEKVTSDKPFFMMLNFADAHSPFKSLMHRWGTPLAD